MNAFLAKLRELKPLTNAANFATPARLAALEQAFEALEEIAKTDTSSMPNCNCNTCVAHRALETINAAFSK